MLTFRIEGIEEIKAAWQTGCDKVVTEVRHGAVRAAQVAAEEIKFEAPEKSGDLKKSIRSRVRATKNGASGFVEVGVDYASHVKDGTKPHPIYPKKHGGTLRFLNGGFVVFAKKVDHPGTDPNDFVTPGIEQGQQVIDADATAAVARLKAKIEG